MSTDQFINRYVSGKPRRPTAPVQTQSDTQLAVHLLGSSREFARSFLSSGMLRPTAILLYAASAMLGAWALWRERKPAKAAKAPRKPRSLKPI